MVAAFNFSSALGRLLCGLCCDLLGPVNTLFMSVLLSGLSMIIIWPVSTSIGPLVVFVIVNGMANGGFFSTMPTVVGNVFGSTRVSVAMGMTVTGWAGGYLLVSISVPRVSVFCHHICLILTFFYRAPQLLVISWMHVAGRTVATLRTVRPFFMQVAWL